MWGDVSKYAFFAWLDVGLRTTLEAHSEVHAAVAHPTVYEACFLVLARHSLSTLLVTLTALLMLQVKRHCHHDHCQCYCYYLQQC